MKWDRQRVEALTEQGLAERYLAGETYASIAAALGCPAWAVHAQIVRLRERGVDLPPRKQRWTEAERSVLAKRRRDGASLREMEAEFGLTRGTLTYHLRVLRSRGEIT